MGRGGVSPTHFFYSMTFGECAAYLRGMRIQQREEWERVRRLAYVVAQVNSTKVLEVEDVMRFPWDDEEDMTEEQRMQIKENEERELKELRERAKKVVL